MSLHTDADLYVSSKFSGTLKITWDSNTEVCNWGGVDVNIQYVRERHPENASSYINVQEDNLPMLTRAEQPMKAFLPILVHDDKSPTLVRDIQSKKAKLPIWVQEDKSPTLLRDEHPLKA
jgi:hypothetical protein